MKYSCFLCVVNLNTPFYYFYLFFKRAICKKCYTLITDITPIGLYCFWKD